MLSKLGGKQNRKTIDGALEAVDWDFELSDLPVTDMFSKLHYIMSPLVNLYVPLSQEKSSNRLVKPPSYLKRQSSIACHNYKDVRQRHGRSSEITGQSLIFYDSIND